MINNSLVDCGYQLSSWYIEDLPTLRRYIREHTLDKTEMRWHLEEFKRKGYIEIEGGLV